MQHTPPPLHPNQITLRAGIAALLGIGAAIEIVRHIRRRRVERSLPAPARITIFHPPALALLLLIGASALQAKPCEPTEEMDRRLAFGAPLTAWPDSVWSKAPEAEATEEEIEVEPHTFADAPRLLFRVMGAAPNLAVWAFCGCIAVGIICMGWVTASFAYQTGLRNGSLQAENLDLTRDALEQARFERAHGLDDLGEERA